jgi:UDP-N-acetyl-D-mannosaminuronic acid dehydrogenase
VKVCVLGLGEIGLPTALLFAQSHEVVGVDIDPERVEALREGRLPFEEPGLRDLFESAEAFTVRTDAVPADAYVVVTPTPMDRTVQVADLTHVRAAAESVSTVLSAGELVVLESTVPPGTSERTVVPTLERGGLDRSAFSFAYCPERAIPGNTVAEMRHNDRVVGGLDSASARRARDLYGAFVRGDVHLTDARTAEFVKLVENTYRDVNIALANEFALIGEELGLDAREAIRLANRHPRVDVLSPGPGVGGHCITIDPQFLAQSATHDRLVSLAREINDSMAGHVLRTVREVVDAPTGATLTVLGAAYKGDVGDTRETPARAFCQLAENAGHEVRVYDPHVEEFEFELRDLGPAVEGSDCAVVVTDHSAFADLDPGEFADRMATRNAVDSRAILDRPRWEDAGFDVRVLGDGR